MKKLIKHLKIWNRWRKYSGDSFGQKLLVLFGKKCPSYYMIMWQMDFYEWYMKSYKEERKKLRNF